MRQRSPLAKRSGSTGTHRTAQSSSVASISNTPQEPSPYSTSIVLKALSLMKSSQSAIGLNRLSRNAQSQNQFQSQNRSQKQQLWQWKKQVNMVIVLF